MPYSNSRAKREFEVHIADIKRVLHQADAHGVAPDLRSYSVSAAIFLAHARFENYVSDLIDAGLLAICAHAPNVADLPGELRASTFAHSLNLPQLFANFLASKDETRLIAGIQAQFANSRLSLIEATAIAPAIRGREVIRTQRYPSEDNLEKVFLRFGIPKIFDTLTARLKTDSKLLLRGLSDKRTELAHNAMVPGTSVQDVVLELDKLKRLVGEIDRVAYSHISKHARDTRWQSEVA
jgi:hypothetical protein